MIPSSLYCHECGAENATDRSVCFACKQPLQISADENVALLQGRYRTLTQVGKGGFGAVYRAEDTQQRGTIVAIKQINLRGLSPQETIEATDAFNREVSLLSHLSHPNLPRIYDNFTDPEHWYLVMDFIEGETLESYLDAKSANYTASLNEVLTLGIQLCTVLDYLHTREPVIIFRDLKPANIMRTPDNKLYLIDFGIARSFKPGKLKDTIPFGSPGYAAPEQYGKAQTTPSADIYSLGALLHMLLSGNDPVDNPFHFSPLRMYGVAGLTDLEALLMRMVQLDVYKRPSTITEVKDELQRIADLQDSPRLWRPPVGQTPPALPIISSGSGQQQISISGSGQQQLYMPQAQRTRVARRKFIIGGFALAGLTIIGAGGIANIVSALQGSTNTGPENSIGTPPHNIGSLFGDVYVYTGHTGNVQAVVWSPSMMVFASAGADNNIQIWSKDTTFGDPNPSYNTMKGYVLTKLATYLAWGSGVNSNLLAYSSDKAITIVTPISQINTSTLITPTLGNNGADVSIFIDAFAWSSSGDFIAFPTSAGIQIWNVALEKVVKHIDFSPDQIRAKEAITSLSWLSDDTYIAAGTKSGKTTIWNVVSGKVAMPTTAIGSTYVTESPDGNWLATVNLNVVYVSTIANSGITTTHQEMPFNVTALAWSPDSKHLVVGGQSSSVNADVNICVWTPDLDFISGTNNTDNGRTDPIPFDTNGSSINSLSWLTDNDGMYIAIAADKVYLSSIDPTMLPSQG